jgi:uncharacterized phage protein (TIGR02218 family)
MRNVPANLAGAINQPLTFLTRIWELTLTNGTTYYFTDLNRDLIFDGETYLFDPGIRCSAVSMSSIGNQSNATIEARTDGNFLSMARVRQGALDGASFNLRVVDWRDPDYYGSLALFSGSVTDVKFHNKGKIKIELDGSIAGGTVTIGELYSRTCRAKLGDVRCKVDLDALAVAFTVATVLDNGYSFTATALVGLGDDRFKFGRIQWTVGNNTDFSDEVKSNVSSSGKASLALTARNPILPADEGLIYPGCDFQVSTCFNKFNNLANFRGEPYVPSPATVLLDAPLYAPYAS